jgi:uncharacterized protein YegL
MRLDITFIIDRSLSTSNMTQEIEKGFTDYIQDRIADQNEGDETYFTLIRFDHEYEVMYEGLDASLVRPYQHEPRGNTALLDSVNRGLQQADQRFAKLSDSEKPDKVLFVIVTDGQENCSQETSRERLAELIQERTEKRNWQFVYLGANQDAFAAAGGMGIVRGGAINYTASPQGAQVAWQNLSSNTTKYSSLNEVKACSYNFFDGAEHVDDVVSEDSTGGSSITFTSNTTGDSNDAVS